jgi:hypothetical protein
MDNLSLITNINLKKLRNIIILFAVFLISLLLTNVVFGQGFSGNDPASYQCFDKEGKLLSITPTLEDGVFVCRDGGEVYRAVIKPPSLQQIEIWFVKIVYFIWAFVATFSFVILLGVAYQYMISRNAGSALADARKRIAQYALGFALVFLAIPILNTTFRLLGVDDSVECYSGLTGGDNNVGIGFQFFFADLCTDPRGRYADPVNVVTDIVRRETEKGTNIVEIIRLTTEEIKKMKGTVCDSRVYSGTNKRKVFPVCVVSVCNGTWEIEIEPFTSCS